MAVTLDGPERLRRLQGWMRQGWVEERNTLGDWYTTGPNAGRRIKKRSYKVEGYGLVEEPEVGPFPTEWVFRELGMALLSQSLAVDEPWPEEMFRPPEKTGHLMVDVMLQQHENGDLKNGSAWDRYTRLLTMERWEKQRRIRLEYGYDPVDGVHKASVIFGGHLRKEPTADFPSQEMVANIALALGAGVDK